MNHFTCAVLFFSVFWMHVHAYAFILLRLAAPLSKNMFPHVWSPASSWQQCNHSALGTALIVTIMWEKAKKKAQLILDPC